MRVVIAPDKFKDSLSAREVGESIAAGILEVLPDTDLVVVPMADGGEGTLDAALASGFTRVVTPVRDPLGNPISAAFALQGATAVIEMAAASGLALVPEPRRDALAASSQGTGDLIRAALDAGATNIILAIGGSASSDGGAGMLTALGARLLSTDGTGIGQGGGPLRDVASVDLSGLDPRVARTQFTLASDVDHPLLGPGGAATVFGPQKGAGAAEVVRLELGLTAFARAVETAVTRRGDLMNPSQEQQPLMHHAAPGAGAAGGLGFAALAVLGADRRPGIDVIIELTRLRAHLAGADLVVTGEGSLDHQSLGGKTPVGVAHAAASLGTPVIAVCGRNALSENEWRAAGFSGCCATVDLAPDAQTSMREAGRFLVEIGRRIAATVPLPAAAHPDTIP